MSTNQTFSNRSERTILPFTKYVFKSSLVFMSAPCSHVLFIYRLLIVLVHIFMAHVDDASLRIALKLLNGSGNRATHINSSSLGLVWGRCFSFYVTIFLNNFKCIISHLFRMSQMLRYFQNCADYMILSSE